MKKKLFKYTIRIVLGLFTLLWGLVAWAALYPDEDYHHCEAGQKDADPIYALLLAVVSLILFIWAWHKTKDWPSDKERKEKSKEELPEPY